MRLDDRTGNRVLAELDYARFPQRHEREFPTYGALIVDEAEGWISRSSLQTIGPDGTPLRALRLLADGRQSFVLFSAADILLATFAAAHDRESDLVRFQRESSRDLVIVQRTAHGVVRVYSDAALIVWDGARWWERPYAEAYASDVLRSVPDCSNEVLSAILEFCIHTLAPAPTGAAVVWLLDHHGADTLGHVRRPVPRLELPALSMLDPRTHGALRQLLSQVDGATLVDRQGRVIEAGVHLTGSDRSAELIRPRPGRGTRHGSARRFSYDESRTVVFVVSEDGPVTVYSDGAIIASIKDPGQAGADDPEADARPSSRTADGSEVLVCERCGRLLGVQLGPSSGLGQDPAACPVCGAPLRSRWPEAIAHSWVIKSPVPPT